MLAYVSYPPGDTIRQRRVVQLRKSHPRNSSLEPRGGRGGDELGLQLAAVPGFVCMGVGGKDNSIYVYPKFLRDLASGQLFTPRQCGLGRAGQCGFHWDGRVGDRAGQLCGSVRAGQCGRAGQGTIHIRGGPVLWREELESSRLPHACAQLSAVTRRCSQLRRRPGEPLLRLLLAGVVHDIDADVGPRDACS